MTMSVFSTMTRREIILIAARTPSSEPVRAGATHSITGRISPVFWITPQWNSAITWRRTRCAVAIVRKNWAHVGSVQAGPKVAAILSVVETCRRMKLAMRDYLAVVARTRRRFHSARGRAHAICVGSQNRLIRNTIGFCWNRYFRLQVRS